jgi:uncharacterized protein YggE
MCSGLMVTAQIKDVPSVSATGKADKEVKADATLVVVFLNADGILMVDAEKNIQEKYSKLEAALKETYKEIKIDQKTAAIGQKQNRNYSPDSQAKPQPEIRKQIILTLPPDAKLVSEIIDTAMRNGAMLSSDGQFSYSGQPNSVVFYVLKEYAQVEKSVQEMAFADFKKNAEDLASLAGKKTGKILMISVTSAFQQQPYGISSIVPFKYYAVEPDRIKVSVSVHGSFELKD